MPALSPREIERLLAPYLEAGDASAVDIPSGLFTQLSVYLDLLLHWNARTNLTAIRDPAEMVQRHFGESLLLAKLLPPDARSVLDLGSGAGFPGIPLQLLYPEALVTLAESQGKKASFLREAVRSLRLASTVHAGRAEKLPVGIRFDIVALRAVDNMGFAVEIASHVSDRLLVLTSGSDPLLGLVSVEKKVAIPGSRDGIAVYCVPRGTSMTIEEGD